MPAPRPTLLTRLKQALPKLTRWLLATGRVVARQWSVYVFALYFGLTHPNQPLDTVWASVVFFWVKGFFETYQISVTVQPRRKPTLNPQPTCVCQSPELAELRRLSSLN